MNYETKYLKYKKKYLDLKTQLGGSNDKIEEINKLKIEIKELENQKDFDKINKLKEEIDALEKQLEDITNISNVQSKEIIELKNWQITKPNSFIDMGSLSKVALRQKKTLFGNCFELKFGPFDTSKTIGKFIDKQLEITNIDENSIIIKDNRDDKIYKLLKSNACDNEIDHKIDLKFRNEVVPNDLKEDYKKFKPPSVLEIF
tara:strand:- start:1975 stop:2580 length:606 start_codon:yes stop_codon:yes gene_type:complete